SNPAFFFKLCHCYRDLHRCRPHYTHGRQNVSARHVFSSVLSFHVCSELPQPLYYCASTTVLPLRRLVELASSLRFCSNPLRPFPPFTEADIQNHPPRARVLGASDQLRLHLHSTPRLRPPREGNRRPLST
ncbi:hypothetical protein S245_034452, partial [Arachis hypogaea]